MRVSIAFITAAISALPAFGAPTLSLGRRAGTCTNPNTRRSWTTFNAAEKQAYFDAELCLMNSPAKTTNPGVITRWDDMVVAHQINADLPGGTDTWHVTGQFLHIHRYYMHAHETILRNECGYTGSLPYWEEPEDAGAFGQSTVLNDFGGDGDANGDVVAGPFGNRIFNIGPGGPASNTPHLLGRKVDESISSLTAQSYVDLADAKTTFGEFRGNISLGVHFNGHFGVGGREMGNILSSPNDPLFFMHHTYIDAVWARWQSFDPARINDLVGAGYETQAEPATGYVATNNATVLNLYDIIPNATVADVADIQGGYLCYQYDRDL